MSTRVSNDGHSWRWNIEDRLGAKDLAHPHPLHNLASLSLGVRRCPIGSHHHQSWDSVSAIQSCT